LEQGTKQRVQPKRRRREEDPIYPSGLIDSAFDT